MADISQIKLPNGDTFDIIDEKSGYITAQYIENKTDYAIPVSRVGEIVVGETAIGTDSTNFPTSKAVVDYVDERVVQEIEAIDVGVTSVNGKTGSITLSASDIGAMSSGTYIPQYTSDLTNDSGFITSYIDEKVKQELLSANASSKAILLASNDGSADTTATTYKTSNLQYSISANTISLYGSDQSIILFPDRIRFYKNGIRKEILASSFGSTNCNYHLPLKSGTIALISDIPQVYSSTNTGGYLTMATLPKYDGTVE